MDLFPEVKSALQEYILTARPDVPHCQNVFLTAVIPYKPLDSMRYIRQLECWLQNQMSTFQKKDTEAMYSDPRLQATWSITRFQQRLAVKC